MIVDRNNAALTLEDRIHEALYVRPQFYVARKRNEISKGIKGGDFRPIRITHQEWNDLVEDCKKNKTLAKHKVIRYDYRPDTYQIREENGQHKLYTAIPKKSPNSKYETRELVVYYCMDDDEKNIDQDRRGLESFKDISNHFESRTGITMKEVFGNVPKLFDFFQLPPIIFSNSNYKEQILHNVSKADFSSAYPANMCGKLPTSIGSIKRKGRVKPTEEYPFAFYTQSHNMAIYGEFDTFGWEGIDFGAGKDWKGFSVYTKDKYGKPTNKLRPFFADTKEEEEETILMKAADYNLTAEMNWLYEQKKNGDETAKTTMVCAIGFMRSVLQRENYFAHLTAICYARHINKMIKAYLFLKEHHKNIVMAATDCMVWIGNGYEGELTTKEKKLGNFILEYTGVDLFMMKCGQYAIQDSSTKEIYLVKHQGFSKEKAKEIEFKSITDIAKLPRNSILRYYNEDTDKWEDMEGYEDELLR